MKEVAHGFHNLHAHSIRGAFERRMEELKTKFDKFMNYYFFCQPGKTVRLRLDRGLPRG